MQEIKLMQRKKRSWRQVVDEGNTMKENEFEEYYDARSMQTYNVLKSWEAKGDYDSLARVIVNIHNNILKNKNDKQYESQRRGIELYFDELAAAKKVENDKEVSTFEDSKKIVLGIGFGLKKIQADAQLQIGPMVEEWKEKIKNGEVEEAYYHRKDDNMVSAMANDIVICQSEPGRDLSSAVQSLLTFQTKLMKNPVWKNYILNDKEAHTIVEHTSVSPFIDDYIKKQNKIPYEKAKYYVKKYETASEKLRDTGFEVDKNASLKDGNPKFSAVPDEVKYINKSKTPEEFDEIKYYHQKLKKEADDYILNAKRIAELSKQSLATFNKNIFMEVYTDKYKELTSVLVDTETIGTDFKYFETSAKNTNKIMPGPMEPVFKKLVDKAKAYFEELDDGLNEEGRKDPVAAIMLKTAENLYKESKKLYSKMEKSVKDLPKSSLELFSEEHQKAINFIDKAIVEKGFSNVDMAEARQKRERKENLENLVACITEVDIAKTDVINGSTEYKEADQAINSLTDQVGAFDSLNNTNAPDAAKRGRAEEMLRLAEEAEKKINAYLKRKAKKKKLDRKATKRVAAMKKSLKSVQDMARSAEDILHVFAAKDLTQYSDMLKSRAELEGKTPEEIISLKAAAKGAETLKNILCKEGTPTENDMKDARIAIAAVTIMDRKLYSKGGKLTENQFDDQVKKLAEDPDFIKATESMVDKNGIMKFSKDISEGAVAVMNNFYEAKSAAFNNVPKTAQNKVANKNANKNVNKNANKDANKNANKNVNKNENTNKDVNKNINKNVNKGVNKA